MSELRGTRWTDGMAIHGSDLSRESDAWKSSLSERFRDVSDYGIVNPDTDMKILPRSGADPLELYITSGKCFPKSREPIEILDPETGSPGFSFWLQPPSDPEVASDSHFIDPYTGNSLLVGDPTGPNLIWLIYWPESGRPAITADNRIVDTEYIQSFKIFVSPASARVSDVPNFFWQNSDRAVLIGVVTPKSAYSVDDADIDLTQSVYPYNRPQFSGRDEFARKKITDYNLLLDTYPNAYVERRSSAAGNTYGDLYTETYLSSDVYRDDMAGTYTGIPGTFYVRTTHFPKFILSANRSDNVDMRGNSEIVSRKKYIALDPVGTASTPILDGQTLTITYAYYNVAEAYLNKNTNPDSVTVLQPLDDEMVLVESTPITVLTADTKIPSGNAQYPAEYTFFINKNGELDVKPRVLFQAKDLRLITSSDPIMPINQPTRPTKVSCYVTGIRPGLQGLRFGIYGEDGSGNQILENIIVKSTSNEESKPGLGNNGTDWVGYYETSSEIFSRVTGLFVQDLDASTSSTTSSNKDATIFVISNEAIDLLHDLPNCRVTIDSAGDALEWTFIDLRDSHIYQSMLSFLSSCQQVTILDGAIKAYLSAGEYVKQGNVVYLKPGQAGKDPPQDPSIGYIYRAVAENDSYKPNVVGIADSDIQAGSSGWVTLRGVVVNNSWNFRPGVLYLSSAEPGSMTEQYPFQYSGSGAESIILQIISSAPDAYVHLNINGFDFYSNIQPSGAPTGGVFVWDSDPNITAQNLVEVINGMTDPKIAGIVTASSDGSVVTIKTTKKATPIRVYQIGDPNSEKLALMVYATNAVLRIGEKEDGTTGTPADGDAFSISGTVFSYGQDWTTATELATLVNSRFGGTISAEAQGGGVVNLRAQSPYLLGSMVMEYAAYGNCVLSFDTESSKASIDSISPELLRYKPTVRCGYAVTSSKVLFDGPIFSKKYASEIYVEDYYKQYKSNQTEGCLVELPKFIVSCRHPLIVPLAGAAPIFEDDDSADGVNRMFVWIQGFTSNSAVICVAIKRKTTAETEYNWYIDENKEHGSFTFRVLPDCAGEISGFKNYGYPDKLGKLLGTNPQLSLKKSDGSDLLKPASLCKNPYSQYDPPNETWGGAEDATSDYITDTDAWEYYGTNGHDMFRFVDDKTIQFGFHNSTQGDGFRFYVTGFNRYTILELAIGTKKSNARVKFFGLGWYRVNFFGLTGDKLRFYLTPRCSEPWIYNPSAGDSDPGLAPAATSPRECKVLESQRLPRICTKYE